MNTPYAENLNERKLYPKPKGEIISSLALILEKQWLHALLLTTLLAGVAFLNGLADFRSGQLWGVPTPTWLWLAVGLAVAHQVYVWFCWRTQLHLSLITRKLGKWGFPLYAAGFAILGILRVVFALLVAIANQLTLLPETNTLKIIAVITLLPALYLFYSVWRYFGCRRALGIDHFDVNYRSLPFERRGIFRFTRNGMYTYGFFLLWAAAFWFSSRAALVAALFNHLYIWVHYFATEIPDIKRIYGENRTKNKGV
jgi:hypothetical protein